MKSTCCICEDERYIRPYKRVDEYNLLICKECSLVFLKDYNSDQSYFIDDPSLNGDNDNLEFWSIPSLYSKHKKIFNHFFKQRLQRIHTNNFRPQKILDIGVGYGFWANYLRESNVDVYGIDISKTAVSFSNETYGLNVEHCSFEEYSTKERFDGITLFDVLEHMEDPKESLIKMKDLLNDDGFIYIQVPNVLGLKYPYGHCLGLPYHIWQFNYRSLEKLAHVCGLEVVQWWSGNQGIIPHYENGGPSFLVRSLWKISNFLKRGNRIQIMLRKKKTSI